MDLSHLNTFGFYNLKFGCRAEGPIEMPGFWGSALHGVFGRALYKQHCSNKGGNCNNCKLKESCTYIRVFSPVPPENYEHKKKYADVPQAMIIRKKIEEKAIIMPGESFSFEIVIVGKAISDLHNIFEAFALAGEMGIGSGRTKFKVTGFSHDTNGKGNFEALYFAETPKALKPESLAPVATDARKVIMQFVTPLHIKEKGTATSTPAPALLLGRLYERIGLLNNFYCGGNLHGAANFGDVEIEARYNLETYKFGRYSARHSQQLKLKGAIGEIELTGNLATYLPLLTVGQYTNIGKMAALGLGQYILKPG